MQAICDGDESNEEGEDDFKIVAFVFISFFAITSILSLGIWLRKRQIANEDNIQTNQLTVNNAPKNLDSLKGLLVVFVIGTIFIGSQAFLSKYVE